MMLCGGGSGLRGYRAASRVNFRWIGVRKGEKRRAAVDIRISYYR
jgi:hypothetical protein